MQEVLDHLATCRERGGLVSKPKRISNPVEGRRRACAWLRRPEKNHETGEERGEREDEGRLTRDPDGVVQSREVESREERVGKSERQHERDPACFGGGMATACDQPVVFTRGQG